MNVVDLSGWLEYLADGANAGFFAGPIEDGRRLLVPAPADASFHGAGARISQIEADDRGSVSVNEEDPGRTKALGVVVSAVSAIFRENPCSRRIGENPHFPA